jgi:FkbM family methyltransferase
LLRAAFKPIARQGVDHLRRLGGDRWYREYHRLVQLLRDYPRYRPGRVRAANLDLEFIDARSFVSSFHEIFVRGIYDFSTPDRAPRLLDLGANIGLAALRFKSLFPDGTGVAVEADPDAFAALERNLAANRIDGVRTLHRAVWDHAGSIPFHREGGDAGRVVEISGDGTLAVETVVPEALFGEEGFDLLKLDIEGAEARVLPALAAYLSRVDRIFVEVHVPPGESDLLPRMLSILRGSGFELYLETMSTAPHPFIERPQWGGFEQQLNVFGYRR